MNPVIKSIIAVGEEECQVLGTNFVRSFLKDVK